MSTDDPLDALQGDPQKLKQVIEIAKLLTKLDPHISTANAAYAIGVSVQTLNNWRERHIGPPYIRLANGSVRYRLSDINAYSLMRRHQTTRLPALGKGRLPVLRYGTQAGRKEAP